MVRKRHGGGMHSEYCPLCLLSYEPLTDIDGSGRRDERAFAR